MLADFYKKYDVPEKDRIPLEKNILFIVPDRDFGLEPFLSKLELSKCEVAVTWPKKSVNMLVEILTAKPHLVIQLGTKLSKKFRFVQDGNDIDNDLMEKVKDCIADYYVVLHHHDEFSIKDGLGTVDQLIKLLKAQRRSFCCVTNHGGVGGWIKQYNACKKAGVKAIFGMEAYRNDYRGSDMEEKKKNRSANHLLLIARTMEGFENIIKIHNDAQINGFYYTPRVNREALEKWGKGIVGSTACLAGDIPQFLLAGEKDKALEAYQFYSKVFDKFYIEIMLIEYGVQQEANRLLIQFAREVGAPLLVTIDSHYLEPEHAETHDVLMCVRQHKTLTDEEGDEVADVWNFDVRNLYYRNIEQMFELFEKGFVEKGGTVRPPFKDDVFTEEVLWEAILNTRRLALETEDIKLDSTIKLPKLYEDGEEILRKKVNDGFQARGLSQKENVNDYFERARYEFDIIARLGWTDYFLIVEEIVSYAKNKFGDFSVGYGRGSAGGSLVSYCLGITDVDPLQYNLLFARFLDESRPTPPDIDLDFDPDIREELKLHIIEKFGEDHVCSIGTYQTYRTRAVILDVARALGKDVGEANEVTKKINPLEALEDESGEEQKVDNLGFDEICQHYPELKTYFELYPEVRYHAEILRNQVKNMGTHAGGVIISDISLKGKIPVLYDKPSSTERKIISAWAESGNVEELSSVGLVKFDILGLNNLPIVSQCLKLIEKNRGVRIRRDEIPIDDRNTIRLASKKDLVGIFQLDNPSTKPVADAVEIESLTDVAVVTSLIRPGPRDMGMDVEYAKRKHGEPYEMPEIMKNLLADTYGVIVFQEQCMTIVQVLAGFTPTESYKFLKAIAKKQKELMASFRAKFFNGAKGRVESGEMTDSDVEMTWNLLEKFARYAFNAAHAYEYSALSCAEMWLKHNYPVEYITSLINNTPLAKKKHGSDVFVDYINYARRSGIEVLPPDVSKSKSAFTIEDDKVLFSLSHVRSVASMASVVESAQPFASVEDFYNRAKAERRPNKGVVESLVAAGAFDSFGKRNDVVAEYYRLRGSKKEAPPQHSDEEWIALEKEAIGLCLSQPPLFRQYESMIREKKWKLISEMDSKRVKVFGCVDNIKSATSKTGNSMYIVTMSDGIDTLNFYVFRGAQDYFKDNFKVGTIAAIPLDRFEDSDTRFFDERKEFEIIVK